MSETILEQQCRGSTKTEKGEGGTGLKIMDCGHRCWTAPCWCHILQEALQRIFFKHGVDEFFCLSRAVFLERELVINVTQYTLIPCQFCLFRRF